jgi:hypothetical protein
MVKQISTTLDDYTYTPDDAVIEREVVAGKRHVESQFNRVIIIPNANSIASTCSWMGSTRMRRRSDFAQRRSTRSWRVIYESGEEEQGPELLRSHYSGGWSARRPAPRRV